MRALRERNRPASGFGFGRFGVRGRAVLAAAAASAAIFVLCFAVFWRTCGLRSCPDVERLSSFQPGGAPVLLDREGEPFADFAPPERTIVSLDDLPDYLPQAFLAVEDKRFFDHDGVDWTRVGGATLANMRSGGVSQGFSTITMQLARSVFPERLPVERRTLSRKILEIRVAGDIEDQYSKEEILELYLNHLYLGNAVHGVGNAARHYFGVDASRVTLSQAATLAALAKSPGYYDPRRRPEQARRRRNLILAMMERQHRISRAEADEARNAAVKVVPPPRQETTEAGLAPYAVEQIRRTLESELGEQLYSSPLEIFTTIDSRMQRAAEEELRTQLRTIEKGTYGAFDGPAYDADDPSGAEDAGYLQGAIVVMDAERGDVLAWVGGRDFAHSRFDRAALARRQVGSAFKPFVYAVALEKGYALSQPIEDAPVTMNMPDGSIWKPQNSSGESKGAMPLRSALVQSNNLATVRLAQIVGIADVASLARRAGIDVRAEEPSIALGAVDASPRDLTAAYTTFAAGGERVRPRMVVKVQNERGKVIWSSKIKRRRVLANDTAYLINDVLSEAVRRGTGIGALPRGVELPVAGKTGTTNDVADAWFVGYTPELVAGVWVGFDQPRPIVSGATASRLAAPVWARLAERIYEGRRSPERWKKPDNVRALWVDSSTGLVLRKGCESRPTSPRQELFLEGKEPASYCPESEELPRHAFVVEMPRELPETGLVGRLVTAWNRLGEDDEPARPSEAASVREDADDTARGARDATVREHDAAAGRESDGASRDSGDARVRQPTAREERDARDKGVRIRIVPQDEAPGDAASEPLPPARRLVNFSGWWNLSTQIESTSHAPYRGLRLGYRVQLEHNGTKVTGRGQKWSENGKALSGSARTPIALEGQIQGNEVVLRFREQGSRRDSSGTFALAWARDGSSLAGSFRSTAADARGSAQAVRLQ